MKTITVLTALAPMAGCGAHEAATLGGPTGPGGGGSRAELVARIEGRWILGAITPLIAAILAGAAAPDADAEHLAAADELARMGLLALRRTMS